MVDCSVQWIVPCRVRCGWVVGEDPGEVRTLVASCVSALGVVGKLGGMDEFLSSLFFFPFSAIVFNVPSEESGDVCFAV